MRDSVLCISITYIKDVSFFLHNTDLYSFFPTQQLYVFLSAYTTTICIPFFLHNNSLYSFLPTQQQFVLHPAYTATVCIPSCIHNNSWYYLLP